MTVLSDWRKWDPPTAEAIEMLRHAILRDVWPVSDSEAGMGRVKAIGVLDALEYRLAYAEPLVGTGPCPYCETCLNCGAAEGPPGRHDSDCPIMEGKL